jgi:hypothetical protein
MYIHLFITADPAYSLLEMIAQLDKARDSSKMWLACNKTYRNSSTDPSPGVVGHAFNADPIFVLKIVVVLTPAIVLLISIRDAVQ